MTQFLISYEQMLPGGNKRRLREERALAEAEQAKAESGGQRQAILREVAFAWLDAWQAIATERSVRELANELGRAIELAQIGVASGRGSQAEVFASRQMLSMAADRRLELCRAGGEGARGTAPLGARTRERSSFPWSCRPGVSPPALSMLAENLEHHPQHAMHLRALGVADADVALAREASASDRTLEFGYALRQGNNRSDMLMFQVTFELPIFSERKQDRLLESKLRLAERAREQRADHLRQLRAELDAAWTEWRVAGERLENFKRATLPASRARLDTLIAAQASGRAELVAGARSAPPTCRNPGAGNIARHNARQSARSNRVFRARRGGPQMNRTAVIVAAALIGAGLAAGGYWLGQRSAQHDAPATAPAASTSAPAAKTDSTGRRILYWHDPMHPQQKFDKPGKSPFMNMELVPVYADAATDEGGVAVSPAYARASACGSPQRK
jgi:hypothetical protein